MRLRLSMMTKHSEAKLFFTHRSIISSLLLTWPHQYHGPLIRNLQWNCRECNPSVRNKIKIIREIAMMKKLCRPSLNMMTCTESVPWANNSSILDFIFSCTTVDLFRLSKSVWSCLGTKRSKRLEKNRKRLEKKQYNFIHMKFIEKKCQIAGKTPPRLYWREGLPSLSLSLIIDQW